MQMFDVTACPFLCPIMGLWILWTYKKAFFEKLLFCTFQRFLLMLLRHSPMHVVVTKKGGSRPHWASHQGGASRTDHLER